MKKISKIIIAIIIVSIFSGCSKSVDETKKAVSSGKNVEHQNINIDAREIECNYLESINGEVKTFNLSIKKGVLEDILNVWIKELSKREISYGSTLNGENILDELSVVDTYIETDNIIILMNDTFKAFESSDSNNYTNPGDFLFGLKDIISKLTDAESMTINYNGKKSDVIGPGGYYIDNINLRD